MLTGVVPIFLIVRVTPGSCQKNSPVRSPQPRSTAPGTLSEISPPSTTIRLPGARRVTAVADSPGAHPGGKVDAQQHQQIVAEDRAMIRSLIDRHHDLAVLLRAGRLCEHNGAREERSCQSKSHDVLPWAPSRQPFISAEPRLLAA